LYRLEPPDVLIKARRKGPASHKSPAKNGGHQPGYFTCRCKACPALEPNSVASIVSSPSAFAALKRRLTAAR
jgi:hypothetical protein